MPELDYALLADAAQVSEGKTYILGGGITILYRSDFPALIAAVLVMQVYYHRSEAESDHELRIQFNDADGNPVIPEIQGHLHLGTPGAELPRNVPLNAPIIVGFPPFPVLQRQGEYAVEILLDGRHVKSLPVAVVAAPAPTPPPAMPDFPEFESESELTEWFESANLSQLDLEEAVEVDVAEHVTLELAGPWGVRLEAAASGTAGVVVSDAALVGPGSR